MVSRACLWGSMDELKVTNQNAEQMLEFVESFIGEQLTIKISKDSCVAAFPLLFRVVEKLAAAKGKKLTWQGLDKTSRQLLGYLYPSDLTSLPRDEELGRRKHQIKFPVNFFSIFGVLKNMPKVKPLYSFILLPILFTLLLIGGFIYLKNKTWAKVELTVSSDQLVQDFDLAGKVNLEPDDADFLPLTLIENSGKKKHQIATTGEKVVGTKAAGAITIYNKTDSDKVFKAGTIVSLITTEDTIKFLMDQEVNVPARKIAAASAQAIEYKSGSASVSVAAQEIGSLGNLAKAQNFTVANESPSSFVAINEADFGGGESRNVRVVTQEDYSNSQSSAKALLLEEGVAQIRSRMVGDQRLKQQALQSSIINTEYSHKVGDETDTLSVTLDLKIRAGVYSEQTLKDMVKQRLEEKVPDNYSLTDDPISVSVENVTGSLDQTLYFNCRVKGFIIPRFKKEELSRSIVGLSLSSASDYLKSLRGLSSIRIILGSPIPFLDSLITQGRLPSNADSIVVEITSQ